MRTERDQINGLSNSDSIVQKFGRPDVVEDAVRVGTGVSMKSEGGSVEQRRTQVQAETEQQEGAVTMRSGPKRARAQRQERLH